jgi:hypothetical protein
MLKRAFSLSGIPAAEKNIRRARAVFCRIHIRPKRKLFWRLWFVVGRREQVPALPRRLSPPEREETAVVSERICLCPLCRIARQLLSQLSYSNGADYQALLSSAGKGLQAFSSPSLLLSNLRSLHGDAHSDALLAELLALRPANRQLVESLLVLAFLPALHRTVREVVKHQPTLLLEDITQQALSVFLHQLDSYDLRMRRSHFAFAISRALKRQMFAWASREGTRNGAAAAGHQELLAGLVVEDPLEREALLRHFLSRCVEKGELNRQELNLLVQFKLERGPADGIDESAAASSNALRQKSKRLLAKLRKLARP